jgi:SOS-response transcriptional repressor LexA
MRPKKRTWEGSLTARIRDVRVCSFGERGRAKFARALGVSPSTYNYYERDRIPPVPILLRISEVTGVDLQWLLTGALPSGQAAVSDSPGHARLVVRIGDLVRRRREAGPALNAFVDLLESQPETGEKPPKADGEGARDKEHGSDADPPSPVPARIPVLGRTAAGVPCFWRHRPEGLVDLLQSAVARGALSRKAHAGALTGPDYHDALDAAEQVLLIQLTRPLRVGELSVSELLQCHGLTAQWPDTFALRVDGDSMDPALSHGDLVVLSPHEAARPGRPAVVQLRNQIGVTCKLFYRDEAQIRLIPINEQLKPSRCPVKDLVWALAVLYRVRLIGTGSGKGGLRKGAR